MKTQTPQPPDDAALLAEHAQIYRDFIPTLDRYNEMGKRVLELQIKIFNGRLRSAFPKAAFHEGPLIVQLSARETPARLGALLSELEEKKIEISRVVYDPRNFTFNLYGK